MYFLLPTHFQWPYANLPGTASQYFDITQRLRVSRKMEVFNSRTTLRFALQSDQEFLIFWNAYLDKNPDKEDYLASLLNETEPFDFKKLKSEYFKFLKFQRFKNLSPAEQQAIHSESESLRPKLYQHLLATEATRLGCDISAVKPLVPVLPLLEGQSKLFQLPDMILLKVITRLETFELFQMTLVCKKWRELVLGHPSALLKAQHSITTHLLTFTDWMDPLKTPTSMDFVCSFQSFGWSLVQWYVGISDRLETLILSDLEPHYDQLLPILEQCPNLKNLHLKRIIAYGAQHRQVHLPSLEALITDGLFEHNLISKLVVDALTSTKNLRVYSNCLTLDQFKDVKTKHPNPNFFSNLIALEIVLFSNGLLEQLAKIEKLSNLKYLKLGDGFALTQKNLFPKHVINQERIFLNRLLLKLNQLEVLVFLFHFGCDSSIITLITKLEVNFKQVVINLEDFSSEIEVVDGTMDHKEINETQTSLVLLRDKVLSKDSILDLSSFEFIVEDEDSKRFFEDGVTGFTIQTKRYIIQTEYYSRLSLDQPAMRKRLGIQF